MSTTSDTFLMSGRQFKILKNSKFLYQNHIIDKLECFVNNDFMHLQIQKDITLGHLKMNASEKWRNIKNRYDVLDQKLFPYAEFSFPFLLHRLFLWEKLFKCKSNYIIRIRKVSVSGAWKFFNQVFAVGKWIGLPRITLMTVDTKCILTTPLFPPLTELIWIAIIDQFSCFYFPLSVFISLGCDLCCLVF